MSIVYALKLIKSRRMFKYDLTSIDLDNIDVHDVKYLPLFFDDDVLFVLTPMSMGAYSVYVVLRITLIRCVTATLGAQQNPQISKMILDSLLSVLLVLVNCNL